MKLLILLFSIVFSLGYSQCPKISINDTDYRQVATCDEFPHEISFSFSNPDIKISKGTLSLVRHTREIKVIPIDSLYDSRISITDLKSTLHPKDRLILKVEQLQLGEKKKDYRCSKVLYFGENLLPTVDSTLDLLINGDVLYRKNGIQVDSIKTIEFVSNTFDFDSTHVKVLLVRSSRLVAMKKLISLKYLSFTSFPNVRPGDRFIVEIISDDKHLSGRFFNIPIIE